MTDLDEISAVTMTVITKPRRPCFISPNHSASSTESLNLIDLQPLPTTGTTVSTTLQPVVLKKCLGKRKMRRYLNQNYLLENALTEHFPIVEPSKSYFMRLHQDDFWLDYTNEELLPVAPKYSLKGNAIRNVSVKIKKALKKRRQAATRILSYLEEDVVQFFEGMSSMVYVMKPRTSFERLLLHGIAQFHALISRSVFAESLYLVEVEESEERTQSGKKLSDVI